MGAGDNFVYSKKDLMVAGVAAAIVVVMLGLGFGLTRRASLPGILKPILYTAYLYKQKHFILCDQNFQDCIES